MLESIQSAAPTLMTSESYALMMNKILHATEYL